MKTLILLTVMVTSLSALLTKWEPATGAKLQEQQTNNKSTSELPVKVTIQTARNSLNAVTDQFKAGDQILVPITMTNSSKTPVTVCISSDLYQDLPQLTKNGATESIMSWQSAVRLGAKRDNTCKELNVAETVELQPNESKMDDWLVLVDSKIPSGADAWYDSLAPGTYELSLQRRFGCCDGPRVQSNKISFDVLP